MFPESHVLAFYIMALGNTLGGQIDFLDRLKQRVRLRQVYSEDECDVIIAYLCVVSRAGTDISAALEKIPTEKPALLVVFHHTFDENYIAPDSRWIVKRNGVLAVDVLFYEDTGMLRSLHNDEALKLSTDYLISLGASQDVLLEPKHACRKVCKWIIPPIVAVVLISAIIVLIYSLCFMKK